MTDTRTGMAVPPTAVVDGKGTSAASATTGSIVVPGRETFWQTVNIPPITVSLPLQTFTRLGFYTIRSAFLTVAIVLFFNAAWHDQSIGLQPGKPFQNGFLVAIVAWVFVLWTLYAIFLGNQLLDFLFARPSLTIKHDGLFDHRTMRAPIAWTDVAHARSQTIPLLYPYWDVSGQYLSVILLPRQSGSLATTSLMRRPYLWRYSWKSSEIVVPLHELSTDARVLALTILHLAKAGGATVVGADGKPA